MTDEEVVIYALEKVEINTLPTLTLHRKHLRDERKQQMLVA